MRRFKRWVLLALVNLAIMECCCLLLLLWARSARPAYFEGYFERLVSAVEEDYFRKFETRDYDPLLGWDRRPNQVAHRTNSVGAAYTETYDGLGARSNPLHSDRPAAASYGESHTTCSEVDDDETWQFYLSQKVEANVQNFGVGGYGPGQALLKLERNLNAGMGVPVVIFTVHEHNVARAVNTFRPFYLPNTGIRLGFKPRFVVEEGVARVLPNPLGELSSVESLLPALKLAKEDDYWYGGYGDRVRLTLPFTLRAVDLVLRALDRRAILDHPYRNARPTASELWEEPGPLAVMAAITERYVELAEQFNFRAVLLLLPVLHQAPDGLLVEPGYRSFAQNLRRRYQPSELLVLDSSEASFDPLSLTIRPGQGHYSADGNRALAEWIDAQLSEVLRP